MSASLVRRNTVRFEFLEGLEMDRLNFSRKILQTVLGFQPLQLDYIFALPGRKVFEVVFTTFSAYELCVERFNFKKTVTPCLQKIQLTPLSERDIRTVTVLINSERIKVEDIATWLSMHCTVLNTSLMRDEDGIKTVASKFQVRLKKDAEGNYHHLPSLIQLGPIRGYVFYNGQPKECRKCGSLDHIAANCELEICRHCKSKEHGSKDCQLPKKCNLCGAESHRFRDCPQAYSNKLKQQNQGEMENIVDLEDLGSTTGDLGSTGNQQFFVQDGMVPSEMSSINPSPQSRRVAEVSMSTLSKEELLPLSRIVDPLLTLNDEKAGEKIQRREVHSLEGGIGVVISTPEKEIQKQKGNILLEVAEAFPLSLSLLSGRSSTSDSLLDDNQVCQSSIVPSMQEQEEVTDWASNSEPFLDSDEINMFSATTQMKESVSQKELSPRAKKEKKRKRLKSNLASPT